MRWTLLLLLLVIAGSGCETINSQQRRTTETRIIHEINNLRIEVQRLDQRLAGLEEERELLHVKIADLQVVVRDDGVRRDADLAALDAQLKFQAQEQGRLRLELADELGSRLAAIMKQQAVSTPVARTQAGYEHVVRSGETLSEIAREYRVSSAAIIKANNLSNPDNLRVGQKLFIPE